MKIHIVNDYDGEWCEIYIDDKLYTEQHNRHSDMARFWEEIAAQLGAEITSEEKCLDPCHTYCDCPHRPEEDEE